MEPSEATPVAGRVALPGQPHEPEGPSRDALLHEREALRAEVRRLEAEVQRHRSHAQRTSKLFESVTSYAAWIRESARRDATLTLKKARARADRALADVERERERTQRELLRLQALTAETRTRLSTFTAAALDVLNAQVDGMQADAPEPPPDDDLRDALQGGLASASQMAPTEAEGLER
jgi:cell division septum initiation protein DivIVA